MVNKKILFFILMVFIMANAPKKNLADDLSFNGTENQILLKDNMLLFYEDSLGALSIQKVLKNETEILFKPFTSPGAFFVQNAKSSYWFKINIKNNSLFAQHYVLESFNYRIDTLLFYETTRGSLVNTDSLGTAYEFEKRNLKHKNLTYPFWVGSGEEKTIYLKVRNRYFTPVELVLRKLEFFTSYALSEYFFLGVFYGSILIVILLNILAGIYLKSAAHYYYSIYVFFVGIFFMSQDGVGFQYLWSHLQVMNDYAYMLSVYFMIIFLLLYTGEFLNLKTYFPSYQKLFYWFIGFRSIVLIINLVFFPQIRHLLYIDVLPFFFAYYCAYNSYRSNYPLSNYFLIGFTVLVFGFMYNFFRLFGWIENNVFSFYLVNICFLLEMIIFYFALAERIRFYKQNSHISGQLKKSIDDKEKLIEQFTYKTSHDLSGPLKSIIGLTNLALSSKNSEEQTSYIQLMRSTALRLDEVLKSLSEINVIRAHDLTTEVIDIKILQEKVLRSPKIQVYYDVIKTHFTTKHSESFFCDSYLLYTALTNLLIYQLKCLPSKERKKLELTFDLDQKNLKIRSSNNCDLVPEEYHTAIFDIFFRLSNDPSDIGTYMHLVKLCVDKLGGNVIVSNKEHSTFFEINIPLHRSSMS